jgi:hypothetical protein
MGCVGWINKKLLIVTWSATPGHASYQTPRIVNKPPLKTG